MAPFPATTSGHEVGVLIPQELEVKVREIVAAACEGRDVEDEWVELKSRWLDPTDAARQIAALANSVGGPHVLWVVGVDQNAKTVRPLESEEFSSWWPRVESSFNEVPPRLLHHLRVPTPQGDVFALLFDATLVPFVWINPAFGRDRGQVVQFEVPWRGSTTTRSARRSELLDLLVPKSQVPEIEVLSATLRLSKKPHQDGVHRGDLVVNGYLTSEPGVTVVIPFHRCAVAVTTGGDRHDLMDLLIQSPQQPLVGLRVAKLADPVGVELISSTLHQVLIQGPGMVDIRASWGVKNPPPSTSDAWCSFTATPVHARGALTFDLRLHPRERPDADHAFHWVYRRPT
jgi:hypothetical protein